MTEQERNWQCCEECGEVHDRRQSCKRAATFQSSAVLPSEAMIEAGAKAFCPNTPQLVALAERCEQATGPDRKLDREIELAVMPERVDPEPRSMPKAARRPKDIADDLR
jgi:hypothetical protein